MANLSRFVGARLRDARIARMKTAVFLAEEVGVTPAAINKYELKNATPRDEVLELIAEKLGVPAPYFFKPEYPADEAPFMMRSLASSTKRSRDAAAKRVDWIREIVTFLSGIVSIPTPSIPDLFAGSDPTAISGDDIEDAATAVRRYWGMKDGPIADLVALLESKGVVTACFSLNAEKLDSFSKWSAEAPIVVDNTDKCTAVRLRFDLAHELGHLVLHRHVDRKLSARSDVHKVMEQQAHRFAGAFLFPATSFRNEIYSISLAGLLEPKMRWKISAQAMIYRARHLGMINEYQFERAYRRLSSQRQRSFEPLDDKIERESPNLLRSFLTALIENGVATRSDLLADLRFGAREIEILTNLPAGYLGESWGKVLPLESKSDVGNVIRFPKRD